MGPIVTGGHVVSVNPKKVDVLLAKEAPECGSEVASLLGAAGYYSKFIKDYGSETNTAVADVHDQQDGKVWGQAG